MTEQAKPCLSGCRPPYHSMMCDNEGIPKAEPAPAPTPEPASVPPVHFGVGGCPPLCNVFSDGYRHEPPCVHAENPPRTIITVSVMRAGESAFVEMNAVFEAVMRAIRGEPLSDFDLSHGAVYEAQMLREANNAHARITADLRARLAEVIEAEDILLLLNQNDGVWLHSTWKAADECIDRIKSRRALAKGDK